MCIESLYYSSFRHGRFPRLQGLAKADIQDKTVPLRLSLGVMLGCCGHRAMNLKQIGIDPDQDGWTWYWPRKHGDWWIIPAQTHEAIKDILHGEQSQSAAAVKKELDSLGFVTSIADDMVREIIHLPPGQVDDPLPRKLRDRVAALLARRSSCKEFEQSVLDWMLIELVHPLG
jgi:hypothetical protein